MFLFAGLPIFEGDLTFYHVLDQMYWRCCNSSTKKLNAFRYPESQLVEINAHSLFSKWFSESGKMVALQPDYLLYCL